MKRQTYILYLSILLLCFSIPTTSQISMKLREVPGDLAGFPQKMDGIPNEEQGSHLFSGFVNPPLGYGESPFYWWVGEKLDKKRILWQLDELSKKHLWGLVISTHHTDKSIFNPYLSEPRQFSEEWWDLIRWTADECEKRGMVLGFNDYTLGYPGEGFWVDDVIKEVPDAMGRHLLCRDYNLKGGETVSLLIPEEQIGTYAYKVVGNKIVEGSRMELPKAVSGEKLLWKAPDENEWRIKQIYYKVDSLSHDAMHPKFGTKVIEKYYQRFEDNLKGRLGRSFRIFDHDEEGWFWIDGPVWNGIFAETFEQQHGYDILPEIAALFEDTGGKTPKVRMDYWNTVSFLMQEHYFKPINKWMDQRGMFHWIDHLGRGENPAEFGNYMAAVRWLTPGMDQWGTERNIIKNKVASSLTHLYDRKRAWLEMSHSIGWGVTPEVLLNLMHYHYAAGMNQYSLHGLYYSTLGGWWEWAPPCFHFRMPYWQHSDVWFKYVERLSFLMSQGKHLCDIAVLYPVSTHQVGMEDEWRSFLDCAATLSEDLFDNGLDFDIIDDASVHRSVMSNGQMEVSGEAYKVLILPDMRQISGDTMRKVLEFYRAGGKVIALFSLPTVSDRMGENDPKLAQIENEIFGTSFLEFRPTDPPLPIKRNDKGGVGCFISAAAYPQTTAFKRQKNVEVVNRVLGMTGTKDFEWLDRNIQIGNAFQVNHRRAGDLDFFMVHGIPQGSECAFKCIGEVELWDAWNGTATKMQDVRYEGDRTILKMPLTEKDAQLIVFNRNKKDSMKVIAPDMKYTLKEALETEVLDSLWRFELKPTMDNQWGDFRLPAFNRMIGAEARKFLYQQNKESVWAKVTYGYGPHFWSSGPLSPSDTVSEWKKLSYSWRWGMEDRPGCQGFHGLKGRLFDDYLEFGTPQFDPNTLSYKNASNGIVHYLLTSIVLDRDETLTISHGSLKPAAMWLNNEKIDGFAESWKFRKGRNLIRLRYDGVGRTHFVLKRNRKREWKQPLPLSMSWYGDPSIVELDTHLKESVSTGCYRFVSPPCLKKMSGYIHAQKARVWVDGKEQLVQFGKTDKSVPNARKFEVTVACSSLASSAVEIQVDHTLGIYGGSVFPEPIALDCGEGEIKIGDWAQMGVLEAYSGGGVYRKKIRIKWEDLTKEVILDLGKVASTAGLKVNGHQVGVRVMSPYTFDISSHLQIGENELEVSVYNSLSNHFSTIPTQYRGDSTSGLLGPVTILKRERMKM